MDARILVILTALCSGLIATAVTIFWQKRNAIKEEKRNIFKILMSTRFDMTIEESVKALNMVETVFYSSAKVIEAWENFCVATGLPESPTREQTIQDKHLRLLEVIAEEIGYKKIKWDNIKQFYYPERLFNKRNDETILRRIQINAAMAQINSSNEQPEVASVSPDKQYKN